uniref:Sucrose-phosphate synthase n=1 Tax=Chenopodium quinoa TaxID=63459 RepID=A0A803LH47_CHEQI
MAGNDWINSYLEAILDVGPGLDDAKSSLLLRERGRFSPTRYFVEEVITGFDETDLHRSWARAQATRSPQERNTRLENMCWRIWNLARQKKQLENEEAQRKAKRRMELERGRREATAEMSEDLSEGEKDVSAHGESNRPRLPRINSLDAMETWISQQKGKKLYLVLISLHGLIRGENMELGRDSDTGGQVKYVVELARALGSMPGVYRVDLLTRQLEQLLKQGRMSKEDINNTYKMMRRIEAEELSLDASEIVITSTRQEIEEQWRLYDGFDPVLERKLRARMKRGVSCYGRFMPRMVVIPPGMEFHHIVPHEVDLDGEAEEIEEHPTSPPPIWTEIMRFFTNPRKPMILALARPDPKKNITTLVKAFGECRPLRELANLTLIMGNRDGIDEMSSTSSSVLMSVLKLIDKYDLYGQVAYPKHHNQADVPEIYRLAAKTKGVFINPAFIEPFGLTLIEAAAHGLPMVATKNGGPVDIQRVLDNGLLVDPHEQQSLATALLKLVADKQLWAKCRQNGLKNIHLYSWPEHCKTYLSRIASCRQRQPQWQKPSDEGIENEETESPSDSLRDIKDISLNLKFSISLDGDKGEDVESLGNDGKNNLENAVMSWSKGDPKDARKARFSDKGDLASSKYPAFRRRKHIYVIAVDGDYEDGLSDIIRRIFDAAGKEKTEGSIGFILSTSYSMPEIQSYLLSKGFNLNDFDAYICNSGSDLYYSSLTPEESPIVADSDYHSHIEYRWGGEGLRRTLLRWAASIAVKKDDNEEQVVTEDNEVSTDYCFAFKIKNQDKVPPSKELRKSMRIQGLRCHVIYCQNGTKMNVIPVLASRSQALRYLYVRWGVDLSKMVVFVGECGDTDYEGLLGGVHKSVIMKGVSNKAFKSLHANRNYPLTHVVSLDSPNIGEVGEGCSSSEIQSIVTKLGNSKA